VVIYVTFVQPAPSRVPVVVDETCCLSTCKDRCI